MIELSPLAIAAITLSLQVASVAMIASLPVAIATAWILSRSRWPGLWLLNALVHLPLILPPVVTGYLLLLGFGRNGPVGRLLEPLGITFAFQWTGAALAAAVMGFPLMVRAIRLAIEAVDPKLEEAAATLGAGPVNVFCTITLPLIAPGILAGAIMGFAKAMGEFGATITFVSNIPGRTQTLPSAIYSALQIPGAEQQVVVLCAISVTLAIGAVFLSEWLTRRIARRIGGAL
ncbi:molybdate ABC transporter permease [Thioclava sp. SK-1]|uniref:molybdate ABC transporter permease subunit n=1 Tax=Thioclava sp. SK-1 TaxID=1889770 RepID=UPI0008262210|nr:molybdate ABC transporter permease subunit [Thioclava sp. SK-1]OCX66773.1 molybdate ABC transporter permease [Thioclava sp. SK-1]